MMGVQLKDEFGKMEQTALLHKNLRLSVVDMIGLEALGTWILMHLLKYGILFLNTI